jgi:hypothetical protein
MPPVSLTESCTQVSFLLALQTRNYNDHSGTYVDFYFNDDADASHYNDRDVYVDYNRYNCVGLVQALVCRNFARRKGVSTADLLLVFTCSAEKTTSVV